MAKGISIAVAADTKAFITAVKRGVIDPAEDAADALADVTRAGDDAGGSLEDMSRGGQRSLRDLARDGDRAGDTLERAFDGTEKSLDGVRKSADRAGDKLEGSFDAARREAHKVQDAADAMGDAIAAGAKRGGRALDTDVKAGSRSASDAVDEFKDEAKSNLSEVVSSFDGSMSSVADLVQGTLGGLVPALGPIGLAAGAAGAVAIGLVVGSQEAAAEATEAYRARVADLTDQYIEAGGQGVLSYEQVADKLRELATEGDDVAGSLSDILERADKTGVSVEDLTAAFTGNEGAIDRQIAAAKKVIREYDTMAAAAGNDTSKLDGNLAQRSLWAKTSVEKLEQVRSAVEEAQRNEQLYLESGAAEMQAKAERTEEYASSITDSLDEVGESWEDYYNAETGALDFEAYNAAIEARLAAMQNYQTNMQSLHGEISDDAYNYLVSLGADAAPLLQAYADAPLDQKERTASNWDALGGAASTAYQEGLKAGLPSTIDGPTVVAGIDTSAVDDYIAGLPKKRLPGPTFFMKTEAVGVTVP